MALTRRMEVWRVMVFLFLSLSLVFAVLFYFIDIFIVLVVGVLLIVVAELGGRDFNRRVILLGYPRWKRRVYMYGLLFFWAFTFFLFIGGQVMEMANLIVEVESHRNFSGELFSVFGTYVSGDLGGRIVSPSNVRGVFEYFVSGLSTLLSSVAYYVFTGVLVIPLMFATYFRGRDRMLKAVVDGVPQKFRGGFVKATDEVGRQLFDFITAKAVECAVVGGVCCLGFYVAGVKGWLFLGALVGVMNVIPYVGPIVGAIPSIVIGYLDSPLTAFLALATNVIAQLIDNYYLYPYLIPSKVKIDPLWSIILILAGAKLLGVIGILFAIPVYIIYKIILLNAYEELTAIYPEN